MRKLACASNSPKSLVPLSTAIDETPSLLMSQLYKSEFAVSFLLSVSTVLKRKNKILQSVQWLNTLVCIVVCIFTSQSWSRILSK